MKTSDITRLAFRNLKGRWVVLPIIGFAIAAFCFCFAGAILTTVQKEKAQPYELILSAQGNASITDSVIADILKISDVKAATPILQVPVTIKTGKYVAQLTLTGMKAEYLDVAYAQGSVFPANSVMPYILLNEAAQKQFTEDQPDVNQKNADKTEADTGENKPANANTKIPEINWLNSSYSLISGEAGRSITSKVCGILSDGDAKDVEPASYISLSVANMLLRISSQPTDAKTAWVRVTNIGRADAVSKQIAALGIEVTNSNEQTQAKWDAEMKEMTYLLVISAFCLLCAVTLLAAQRIIVMQQQKGAFEMLRWMGIKTREVTQLLFIHALIIAMIGTALGVSVSLSIPSFLPLELKGISSYTLSIPFLVAAGSFGVCIIAGVIPACFVKARQSSP